jgi:phosphatidylglycerophosphate synthase
LTLDELRRYDRWVTVPLAAVAERAGASPNQLSALSLAFAIAAAAFYYLSEDWKYGLYLAGLMVLLNATFDAADGALARRIGKAEPRGDFLDHVVDRYSDMFIMVGIIFGGYVSWKIGLLAAIGVLLTSYIGTEAQALMLGRYYGGIMGRADRLTAIFLATIANALYPEPTIAGLSILGLVMALTMFSSHITAIQRFIHIWRRLS